MLVTTTPKAITPEILAFCWEVDPTTEPVYIPVRPALTAVHRNCFINVREEMAHHGGDIQHGWLIWERPGWYLDVIFHAVWVSPDGQLIDITPTDDGEDTILFLPDCRKTFYGEVVPTRIRPLSDRPHVRKFIEMAAAQNRAIASIQTALIRRRGEPGRRSRIGRNHPCRCGSNSKYKTCCGRGTR